MPESWIYIGRVRSVNPSARRLRIRPEAYHADRFDQVTRLGVILRDGTELRCKVESVCAVGGDIGVLLAPGVPRDNVGKMKGAAVMAPAAECGQGGVPDVHAEALRGFLVMNEEGAPLGRVAVAYETAAHGVVEIERPDGAVVLLPVVPEVIVHIDLDRGVVVTVADIAPFAVQDTAAGSPKDRDED